MAVLLNIPCITFLVLEIRYNFYSEFVLRFRSCTR